MAFTIVFTPRAEENLSGLRKGDQQTIVDALAVFIGGEEIKL